jgi:hypothetical protein
MRITRLSPAALLLMPLVAMAAPPLHLQKGEWSYHGTTTINSGPMAGRTLKRDWKQCVVHADRPPKMTPHPRTGQVSCTAPTMTTSKTSYRTTMSCTSKVRGMTMKLDEDYTFTPADDGASVNIKGTVHQTISGAPVAMPAIDMHTTVTGKRTGACNG